jgi:hypothetical protein
MVRYGMDHVAHQSVNQPKELIMIVKRYSAQWAILRDTGSVECGQFEARDGTVYVLMQ